MEPVLHPPCRVTIDYVNSTLSPLVLILKWERIPGAEFYVVQKRFKGEVDWTILPTSQEITTKNELLFSKEICTIYEFRVAAAKRTQISRFSKIITSPKIKDLPIVNIIFRTFANTKYPDRPKELKYRIAFSIPDAWKVTPNIGVVLADYINVGKYAIYIDHQYQKLWNIRGTLYNAFYQFYPFTLKLALKNVFLLYVRSVIFSCGSHTLATVPVQRFITRTICTKNVNPKNPEACGQILTSFAPYKMAQTKKNYLQVYFFHFKPKHAEQYLNVSVTNSTITKFCGNPLKYASEVNVKPIIIKGLYGRDSLTCKPAARLIDEYKHFYNSSNKTNIIPDTSPKSTHFQSTPFHAMPSQSVTSNVISITAQPIPSQSTLSIIIISIMSSFICVGALFIISWIFCKRRYSIFNKIMARSNPLYFLDHTRHCDKWEILRNSLIIHDDQKLGSGAFGSVYKGELKLIKSMSRSNIKRGGHREELVKSGGYVAVKMLPKYADHLCKADFLKEINLMKTLGYHERIVNMIACITKTEPICLVVEYCTDGDLLHYLRTRRHFMIKLNQCEVYLSPDGLKVQDSHNMLLSLKDLLSFAWQASVGMEYLWQKGFIHRDLAARNVLVTEGKKAKIGDFGLCRFSNNDVIYIGRGGKLPLKWMALESITNFEFTHCSDVWSFGVLLFEIITLGGSPYPGILPSDMKEYLKLGKRMKKPDKCPDELYELILKTWHAIPNSRPNFTDIAKALATMLEQLTEDYYLSINQNMDYYNVTYTGEDPGKSEKSNNKVEKIIYTSEC